MSARLAPRKQKGFKKSCSYTEVDKLEQGCTTRGLRPCGSDPTPSVLYPALGTG